MTNAQVTSEQLFKEVMGGYPSGVTVITTVDANQQPIGLTANSFVSVSIDPLLVLWCIDKKSGSLEAFEKNDHFAVNILAADQETACWTFANRAETDRFSKVDWSWSEKKVPLLEQTFATFECEKDQIIDAGDHYILLGKVINIEKNAQDPMLYYRRKTGAVPTSFLE